MTPRLVVPAVRRSSMPLTERDEQDLRLMRTSPVHRNALQRLSGVEVADNLSEAGLLHAIFAAGVLAITEQTEDAGYAELARQEAAQAVQHRAEARRRTPDWAPE